MEIDAPIQPPRREKATTAMTPAIQEIKQSKPRSHIPVQTVPTRPKRSLLPRHQGIASVCKTGPASNSGALLGKGH